MSTAAEDRQKATKAGHRIGTHPWWVAFREFRTQSLVQSGVITQEQAMPTPEQVIEAARALNAELFDLAAVGWVHGTTVLVVYKWDSTAAVHQTLSEDLRHVVSTDYIPKPNYPKGKK